MFKSFFVLLFFLPFSLGISSNMETTVSTCPEVTNVQRTGQTTSSISYSWNAASGATGYKVWFEKADGTVGGTTTVQGTSHTFANLTAGSYTFYFQSICPSGSSGFIGIEDILQS